MEGRISFVSSSIPQSNVEEASLAWMYSIGIGLCKTAAAVCQTSSDPLFVYTITWHRTTVYDCSLQSKKYAFGRTKKRLTKLEKSSWHTFDRFPQTQKWTTEVATLYSGSNLHTNHQRRLYSAFSKDEIYTLGLGFCKTSAAVCQTFSHRSALLRILCSLISDWQRKSHPNG